MGARQCQRLVTESIGIRYNGQLTAATEGATRARIAEVLKLARAIDMVRLGRVGGIWFNVEKESE